MTASQLMDLDAGFSSGTDGSNQYLTFILCGEEYGVDILRVQEIRGWDTVTPIPKTPEYIKGVINIRGTIVPIIDLRQRFGMQAMEYGPMTVVIVLRVISSERERVMGIIVDAVSDTYTISDENLKEAPDFGSAVSVDFVKGLATVDEKMLILLDIDHLLNSGELSIIEHATE